MHGPNKRPSRGVCQICGRPVVAFEFEATGGCFRPGPIVTNGHKFNSDGRLVAVRCAEHWNGLRVNARAIEAPPSQDDIELAAKIRGAN